MKNRLTKKDKLYYKDGGFFNKVGEQINTGIANVKDTTVKGTFGEIGDQANKIVKNNTNFKNVNELGAEALKYGKDAAVVGGLGALSMTGIGMPITALTGKSLDNLVGYEAETDAGKLAQRGTQTYAGVQGMIAPMAANAFAPGSGMAVSAAQKGIGGIPALNNPNQAQSFIPQGMEGALSSSLGMAGGMVAQGGNGSNLNLLKSAQMDYSGLENDRNYIPESLMEQGGKLKSNTYNDLYGQPNFNPNLKVKKGNINLPNKQIENQFNYEGRYEGDVPGMLGMGMKGIFNKKSPMNLVNDLGQLKDAYEETGGIGQGAGYEHGGKLTQFKGGIKGKTDSIEIMPGVMVNDGETAMKTPQGDFVINSKSDKVTMALGGINPAKESKRIEKISEFRKNDLLTQNMTNKFQNNLSSLSAKIGSLLNPDAAGYEDNGVEEYKYGGIHIKESNKGKFTASAKAAGHSVQEHAHAVVNNPNSTELQRKRAQFAINAKKFHHEDGGMLRYDDGGVLPPQGPVNTPPPTSNGNQPGDIPPNQTGAITPYGIGNGINNPPPSGVDYNQIASYATLGLGALAKSYPMIQELRRLKKDTPETVAYNRIKYDDIAAKTVDPRAALAQAGQENRTNDYTMRQASAGNLGSYLSNMSAARLANARNKTNINYEYDKANAGIMNQAAQFNAANRLNTAQYNAAIGDKESDVNSQTRANYENQMFKLRQGLGDTAASALNTANTQYFGDKLTQNTNTQNEDLYAELYTNPENRAIIDKLRKR